METKHLMHRVYASLGYNYQPYQDLYDLCRENIDYGDQKLGTVYLVKLSDTLEKKIPNTEDPHMVRKLYDLHRKTLLKASPHHFEAYCQFLEWNREPSKKFYMPRRKVLRNVAYALQDLEEGKLDLLALSMPPGAGKSTLAIFYLTWIAGRDPNNPSLTGSHSNSFVRGVYDETLRIFDKNGEYLWYEVFPELSVTGTNAKDCRIDIDKRQRFETLEFTSVGTGNAGLYRAAHLLYCDDLVSGIEEAMSKERLDKLWNLYTTDLRQRKIGDKCKELHIATRWSVHDVIGRLEREYGESPRARFIVLPAMNEKDESNFDYDYGVGFTTAFYRQQRDIMDDVSWRALYMNQPIEREGLLYHEDELNYYMSLPEGEPDAVLSVCDTKDKGKDYCSMPVVAVYGNRHYLIDAICDNGLPEIVEPRLADCMIRNKIKMSQFESNSAGGRVAKAVDELQKKKDGITHITTKFTTSNKETKIIVNSGWIKEHMFFPDKSTYKKNSDIGRFMDMLTTYTVAGKNKHDDVPDSIAQYAEFYQQVVSVNTVEIFKRPF